MSIVSFIIIADESEFVVDYRGYHGDLIIIDLLCSSSTILFSYE